MKKSWLIFILCFFMLFSCTKNTDKIIEEKMIKVASTVSVINKTDVFDNINFNDYKIYQNDAEVKVINLAYGANKVELKGDKEISLTIYRLKPCSVKFVSGNDLIYETEVEEESVIKINDYASYLAKDGYDYSVEASNLEIKDDTIFRVKYTKKDYELKIHYDTLITKIIHVGDTIDIERIDIEGYTLTGLRFGDGTMIDSNLVYEARFGQDVYPIYEANNYKITYKWLNSSKTVDIKYGDEFELFTPNVKGYHFDGWYYNDILFDDAIYLKPNDITLVAKMTPNEYNITYKYLNKEVIKQVLYNEPFELFIPSVDGYEFYYWTYNGARFNDTVYKYTTDIELIAVMEKIYDIDLNLELFGGTLEAVLKADHGIVTLPNVSKEGYKFTGWYTDIYYENKITSVNLETYNSELIYAGLVYDDTDYKCSFPFTLYNDMTDKYDETSLYSSDERIMASLYWQKIGIINVDGEYYISSIKPSGESISTLGDYDYVMLSYSAHPHYSEFCNLDIKVGDKIAFSVDPSTLTKGSVICRADFINIDITDKYAEIINYLKNLYDSYFLIENDIELVTSYQDYTISWVSNNTNVISNAGVYHAPNSDTMVTLKAYVAGTKIYSIELKAKGSGAARTYLSTGYIYTNYGNFTSFAADNLDVIYCSFLEIDESGNWTNLSSLMNKINTYVRPKTDVSGTKLLVSINQKSSGNFSSVAGDATLREAFADRIVKLLQDYNLDGLDIDWETPSSSEAGNFTLMMQAIYEKCKAANSNYLVTAAIGGGKWAPPKYDLPNSINYLDYVNLMTYSMTSAYSYHQSALYKSTKGATLVSCSIDESIVIYNNLSVPNNKILVGIPFYCVLQSDSNGFGSKTGTGKSISYSSFLNNYKNLTTMVEYFDEECGVPYCYDATNKYYISYDNDHSVEVKCAYIHNKGLAGLMFWQYGQDVNDYFMTAISKYLN